MRMDNIYYNLQECFIKIRHFSSCNTYDLVLYDKTIQEIKIHEKYIIENQLQNQHRILLYCIKTLFQIINEKNKKKIFDFADTIHNIPEIYLGKRNFESFYFEINEFCKKYGKEYFQEI